MADEPRYCCESHAKDGEAPPCPAFHHDVPVWMRPQTAREVEEAKKKST